MPLYLSERLPDHCQLLVWKLEESEEELHQLLPPQHDNSELQLISHPQKKREWLASRIIIMKLAEFTAIPYEGVWKDEHGKPFLIGGSSFISITHTLDFVAGTIHRFSPVGIDMEQKNEKLIRISSKFLSGQELAFANNHIGTLCALWCAKEAMFKLNGRKNVSFKMNISITPVLNESAPLKGQLLDDGQVRRADIHIRWLEDYCLALAFESAIPYHPE